MKNKKIGILKKVSLFLLIGLLFVILVPGFVLAEGYTIGMSQRAIGANIWWDAMIDAIEKELDALGGHTLRILDAQEDIVQQIRDVEYLIMQDVDGILINPVTEIEVRPAVIEAYNAGIPVVMGNENADESLLPYIATNVTANDYAACFAAGVEMARRMRLPEDRDTIKALIVAGTPDTEMSLNRRSGLIAGFVEQMLKRRGSLNLDIVGIRYAYFYPDTAREEVEPILQANPDVDVIFSETDEHTRGFMGVLEDMGKAGEIQVVSLDGIREVLEYIMDGKVTVTAVNPPQLTGVLMARAIVAAIEGEDMPSRTYVPSMVITEDNAADYYDPESTFTDHLMFPEEFSSKQKN